MLGEIKELKELKEGILFLGEWLRKMLGLDFNLNSPLITVQHSDVN